MVAQVIIRRALAFVTPPSFTPWPDRKLLSLSNEIWPDMVGNASSASRLSTSPLPLVLGQTRTRNLAARHHPVLCHLLDVAAVSWQLWQDVFRPPFAAGWPRTGSGRGLRARDPGSPSGAVHDIGKVAACFQNRNDHRTAALKVRLQDSRPGFTFHVWNRPQRKPSARPSSLNSSWPRRRPALPRLLAECVAVAVGGHHGLFPDDWNDVSDLLRSAPRPCPWDQARREILADLARLCGVGTTAPHLTVPDDQAVFMVLAGLTSVADWIGSNQEFFARSAAPLLRTAASTRTRTSMRPPSRRVHALRVLGWLDRGARPAP